MIDKDFAEALAEIYKKLLEKQQPMDRDMAAVFNGNYEDLYEA